MADDLTLACFDLNSDEKHCGSCETACEKDGLCIGGTCEYPEDLATDQGNPKALAVDADYVYYATGTDIRRVPIDGSEEPTVLGAPGASKRLVLAGDSLYYADDTKRLLRLSIDGGEPTELVALASPSTLAVHEGTVYFLEGFAIKSVSIEGGDVTVLKTAAADVDPGIVVNDDGIYVAYSLAFHRYSHDGTTFVRVAGRSTSDQSKVLDFAVYGDALYYSTGGRLERSELGSMYPGHGLTSDYVQRFVIDRDEIVFVGTQGIEALPVTDEDVEPRVLSADYGTDLAVSADYVYWTRGQTTTGGNDGKIRRVRR
jgi:hypothetical protein